MPSDFHAHLSLADIVQLVTEYNRQPAARIYISLSQYTSIVMSFGMLSTVGVFRGPNDGVMVMGVEVLPFVEAP